MAINNTESSRADAAASELADKLKLESKMIPALRRLFKRMANDLEASVLLSANESALRYVRSLETIINEQYERTEDKFGNRITDQLAEDNDSSLMWLVLLAIGRQRGLNTKTEVLAYIRAKTAEATEEFINTNVEKDTSNITTTNSKNLDAAVATAGAVLVERLGREPTKIELAEESKKQFLDHNLGRVNTIAATVTQKAAEGTKDINREVFVNYRNSPETIPLQIPRNKGQEVWVSMGDSIARIAHLLADGQHKENGTFTVMGQLLKFPGDDSLGATLDNLINCRCSSIYTFEESGNIPKWVLEQPL